MRSGLEENAESSFDLPPRIHLGERRRAGLAAAAWQGAEQRFVPGFDEFTLIVDDPGGMAALRRVGQAVSDTFGLVADMALTRRDPINIELSAACDLIALRPEPLHFEASLMAPRLACILLRGVALPIEDGRAVQIVLSWREVLNRAASVRLRREFTAALAISPRKRAIRDPFSSEFGPKAES
jgi:hypothetical protein